LAPYRSPEASPAMINTRLLIATFGPVFLTKEAAVFLPKSYLPQRAQR
jgi:hypothetical protein